MHPSCRSLVRHVTDERGIALPLALLGLISVSLLVTTALVTSSTELAISGAHQDATRALYVAEGGLQAYVATDGAMLMDDAGSSFRFHPPGAGTDEAVDLSVVHLGNQLLPETGATLRLFSITSSPTTGGGRSVSAVVKQIVPAAVPLDTDVKSAITLGGNLDVNGNAFTVSGRSSACESGGVQAVRHAADSEIGVNNEHHWENFVGRDSLGNATVGQGAVENSGLTKQQLAAEALGLAEGQSLEHLIERVPASHRWGPRFSPPGGPVRQFDGRVDTGEQVAVVDGNGGTVELYGGAGLLIIVNGSLEMTGNAAFDGIIIVEGNFTLKGTPTVSGALISLDDENLNQIELDASAIANGHITVQYDRCTIEEAEEAFGELAQQTMIPEVRGTFAWLEVTR